MNQGTAVRGRQSLEGIGAGGLLLTGLVFMVAFLGIIPALADESAGQETQIGDFVFQMPPADWTRQDREDWILFVHWRDWTLSVPSASIALRAWDLGSLGLQAAFDQQWKLIKKDYRILQGEQIGSYHSPNGYDAFYANALASDAHDTQWSVFVMGAQYGGRYETIVFMSSSPPRSYAAEWRVLQTFLASLRFAPPPLPAGLAGLIGTWAKASNSSSEGYTFHPDGTYEMFHLFRLEDGCEFFISEGGTFTADGRTLSMKMTEKHKENSCNPSKNDTKPETLETLTFPYHFERYSAEVLYLVITKPSIGSFSYRREGT